MNFLEAMKELVKQEEKATNKRLKSKVREFPTVPWARPKSWIGEWELVSPDDVIEGK